MSGHSMAKANLNKSEDFVTVYSTGPWTVEIGIAIILKAKNESCVTSPEFPITIRLAPIKSKLCLWSKPIILWFI